MVLCRCIEVTINKQCSEVIRRFPRLLYRSDLIKIDLITVSFKPSHANHVSGRMLISYDDKNIVTHSKVLLNPQHQS